MRRLAERVRRPARGKKRRCRILVVTMCLPRPFALPQIGRYRKKRFT